MRALDNYQSLCSRERRCRKTIVNCHWKLLKAAIGDEWFLTSIKGSGDYDL